MCESGVATWAGTCWAVRPENMAAGTLAVRPTTMSEKKMPMESGMPSVWPVARMPEATPRSRAGTLFMMAAVLGAANMPKATPLRKMTQAKSSRRSSAGRAISSRKLSAASTMPVVAKGRAPWRSERIPETGPATRNPSVSGSM